MKTDSISNTPAGWIKEEQVNTGNELGKNEFVRLLMAQLRNQDPLSPADSTAFVAQLAQFANVELLQNVNDGLDALMIATATGNQVSFMNLVDKKVSWKCDEIILDETKETIIHGHLSDNASNLTVTVVDEHGNEVRVIRLGANESGGFEVAWDGRDDKGRELPEGKYTVRINATDAEGNKVESMAVRRGRVEAVSYEGGLATLVIGSEKIRISDVFEVRA